MKKGAWANIPPKSNRSDPICFQPVPLSRSQPGRTVLQQDQTMSLCGEALRQACGQLPCLRPTRIYPATAGRALRVHALDRRVTFEEEKARKPGLPSHWRNTLLRPLKATSHSGKVWMQGNGLTTVLTTHFKGRRQLLGSRKEQCSDSRYFGRTISIGFDDYAAQSNGGPSAGPDGVHQASSIQWSRKSPSTRTWCNR